MNTFNGRSFDRDYDPEVETNIPWKIPHYKEQQQPQQQTQTPAQQSQHSRKNLNIGVPSRSNVTNLGNRMSPKNCNQTDNSYFSNKFTHNPDIKFINFVLEEDHYKYVEGPSTQVQQQNRPHNTTVLNTSKANFGLIDGNSYIKSPQNDAIQEFNSLIKGKGIATKSDDNSPTNLNSNNLTNNKPEFNPSVMNNPINIPLIPTHKARTKSVPVLNNNITTPIPYVNNTLVSPVTTSPSTTSIINKPLINQKHNHNRHYSAMTSYKYSPYGVMKPEIGMNNTPISNKPTRRSSYTRTMSTSTSSNSTPILNKRSSSQIFTSNKTTPTRYYKTSQPRKYMDGIYSVDQEEFLKDDYRHTVQESEEDISDDGVGRFPKDMEIDLEQLLSCDTVDRVLSVDGKNVDDYLPKLFSFNAGQSPMKVENSKNTNLMDSFLVSDSGEVPLFDELIGVYETLNNNDNNNNNTNNNSNNNNNDNNNIGKITTSSTLNTSTNTATPITSSTVDTGATTTGITNSTNGSTIELGKFNFFNDELSGPPMTAPSLPNLNSGLDLFSLLNGSSMNAMGGN